jgi:hypothetical protein
VTVGKNEAEKASREQGIQQFSTSSPQQAQYQSLKEQ